MRDRVETMKLISSMNHFAASYREPIESYANIFFSGSKKCINPGLIYYFKSKKCADIATMDNLKWIRDLSQHGYDAGSIINLSDIKLWAEGDSLQDMLNKYSKDPEHKDHTFYQAMQALIIDYEQDLKFPYYMDCLSNYSTDKNYTMEIFRSAHTNMSTMSELESKFNLIKTYLDVSSMDFDNVTNAMLKLQADILQNTPELSSLIKEYLDEKSEELLLLIAEKKDCSEFYVNVDAEIRLLRYDMQDSRQLKKSIDFLVGNCANKSDEYRELAAIQIINSYVKQHPEVITSKENEVELKAIARIYKVEHDSVIKWFETCKELTKNAQDVTMDLAIIRPEKESEAFSIATKNLTRVQQQLTDLFQGSPEFNTHVRDYIDDQKQIVLKMVKNNNDDGLKKHAKTSNIITAISGILVKCPEINQKLKRKKDFRNPVLLAEQLRKLDTESPQKAEDINAALTEVLTKTPDMTFDKLVGEMKSNKDSNTPIGKLETAMGSHRNLFLRIMHFFFPDNPMFYTNTIGIFKNKIQDSNYTDEDMDYSSNDFS